MIFPELLCMPCQEILCMLKGFGNLRARVTGCHSRFFENSTRSVSHALDSHLETARPCGATRMRAVSPVALRQRYGPEAPTHAPRSAP